MWHTRIFGVFNVFCLNFFIKILENHLGAFRAIKNIISYFKNLILEKNYSWPFPFKQMDPKQKKILIEFTCPVGPSELKNSIQIHIQSKNIEKN